MFNAQLTDLLRSSELNGKKVTLFGISFSAQSLTQFLMQTAQEVLDKIDKVVMMEGLQTLDDLESDIVKRSARLIQRFGVDTLVRRFAGTLKSMFNKKDATLFHTGMKDEELRTKKLIEYADKISNASLIAQLKNLFSIPGKKRNHILIPAMIIWWENEIVSKQGRDQFESLFPLREVHAVPYHHAWTGSSAATLNPLIEEFLR